MIRCPTCWRFWLPLPGDDPAGECNLCRRRIGTCALVDGRLRVETEREGRREQAAPEAGKAGA